MFPAPSGPLMWDPRVPQCNAYVRFLHRFSISSPPPAATLAISADSNYGVWINGSVAGFGQYADYPHYKIFDSLEVSRLLRPGANTIAILGYHLGENCSVYTIGQPGVVFSLTAGDALLTAGSAETLSAPAPEYRQGEIERFSIQLSFGFGYDATAYDGWHDDGYVPGSAWQRADAVAPPDPLLPRPIEKLAVLDPAPITLVAQGAFTDASPSADNPGVRMQMAALTHIPLRTMVADAVKRPTLPDPDGLRLTTTHGDGSYAVLDLGREDAGLLTLDLDVGAGVLIDISFGEHLEDLRVRSQIDDRTFAVTYRCRGGRERFTHYLKRLCCRYIQLHIRSPHATLYYAGLIPTAYPVAYRGDFVPADHLHHTIYATSLRTLELCMHEHYEDGPWREQALYAMDARNQMLCGYYAFGEYRFPRASLLLLAKGQRADGLLELCAPAKVNVNIPCFSLMWIVALYEYCLFSGDTDFGRALLPVAERILDVFASAKGPEGLVTYLDGYWNFYEWADGLDGRYHTTHGPVRLTQDAPLNGFYAIALSAMATLCDDAGKPEAAAAYAAEKEAINQALNHTFWNDERRLYASYVLAGEHAHYAELTQALMVACGAGMGARRSAVLAALAAADNGMVPVTLSHSIFKYEALLTTPKRYGTHVFDEIARKWGDMLFAGATSFWETEAGAHDFNQAGSLCHGWSAVPVYLYFAYVFGIRPQAPGFARFTCRPVPTGIASARGLLATPNGQRRLVMGYDGDKPHVKFE